MNKDTTFRREIRAKINELLCEVQNRNNETSVSDITEKIVSMICDPLTLWQEKSKKKLESDDDFSASKERWIAP